MKILLIDDDEVDRLAITRALNQASLELNITQTDNAIDGMRLAISQPFDIILLDYRLQDRDGIEVLMELRHSNNHQVTVIMLSRYEDDKLAETAFRQGAQDFLLKDEVNPKRLLRAMHQAQQRHKLEEDLRISHEKLRQLAEQDPLTGLANRYEFECALNLAVARANREHLQIAVLLLDIDRFKQVNDTFGHDVGDDLLVEASRRLKTVVRDSDLLARLGGDEFVVLLQDLSDINSAINLANRIVKVFNKPMTFHDADWLITASVGIAMLNSCTQNAVELMKCADIAMYRAKQEGRNQAHFYSTELHNYVKRRNLLEQDIRHALTQGEFVLYYQPQVNSHTGELVGMEALLRWQHPRKGLLAPGDFLTLAEELGLMNPIGHWVMTTACEQLALWHKMLPENQVLPTIAVNLSPLQLHGVAMLSQIKSVLNASGLAAQYLELEITESAIIKNPEKVALVLSQIADTGVRLALDDFGTGYSSFEHLKLFPIHNLKIDRSFIRDIAHKRSDEQLLTAIINFARTLGLKVTAEGIEQAQQAEFCRIHGADILQGYYYAKPMSAEQFEQHYFGGRQINEQRH